MRLGKGESKIKLIVKYSNKEKRHKEKRQRKRAGQRQKVGGRDFLMQVTYMVVE